MLQTETEEAAIGPGIHFGPVLPQMRGRPGQVAIRVEVHAGGGPRCQSRNVVQNRAQRGGEEQGQEGGVGGSVMHTCTILYCCILDCSISVILIIVSPTQHFPHGRSLPSHAHSAQPECINLGIPALANQGALPGHSPMATHQTADERTQLPNNAQQ